MSDPHPATPLPVHSIWKHLYWAVFRIHDILLGAGLRIRIHFIQSGSKKCKKIIAEKKFITI
jgi:hypothetical protein